METYVRIVLLSCLLSITSFAEENEISSAIQPVHNLHISIKTLDEDLFKSCFSIRIKERLLKERSWKDNLLLYRKRYNNGDFKISDFTYKFQSSTKNTGKVFIFFKGRKIGLIKVIKEIDVWKMDEE